MATGRAGAKPSKKKRLSSAHQELPGSIFGADNNDVIPGEVILQLDEAASGTVTESIARGPLRGGAGVGATTFGAPQLDSALAGLKVISITRLHPPAPMASMAMSEAVAMASTFRVRFDPATGVDQAIQALEQVEGVLFAEPNVYRETYVVPSDPSFASQWGLSKINCPAAWDITTGKPEVIVAVIDTGVDLDHPELAPLLVPGTDRVDLGTSPTPPPGFHFEGDFTGVDSVPQDEVGHGTHVAGTIACLSNNATGVAGVTWDCRVMPVRVLARIVNNTNPADVRGVGSAADIAAGIRWAVDNGARVLNLSLGGSTDTFVERDAIAYAIAHNVVVCAAMGNGGLGGPTSFPAAYPDVVAVGAIDSADHRASFSQVGPHIDIAAPGVGILSTVWDNGYATMSGTSMATPHVAGVAALVMSCNRGLSSSQVADILRNTARPLRDDPGDPVPNDNYGFGCVDAEAAVKRACPVRPPVTEPIVCQPVPSRVISTCRVSVQQTCLSQLVRCTQGIICRRTVLICPRLSLEIPCPSRAICGDGPGRPGPPGDPGPGGARGSAWSGQRRYGQDNPGGGEYDPYAGYYDEGSE